MELKELQNLLDAPLARDCVSEREGGNGAKLSYVSSFYVIDRLNKTLGQGSWSYDTQEMRLVHSGEIAGYGGKTKHVAHYVAKVSLHCNIAGRDAIFSDYGYGDGSDAKLPGKAHELAVKEAATDALKRCAKNLGMSLGLALYEKEQNNVDERSEAERTGAATNAKLVQVQARASAPTNAANGAANQPVPEKAPVQEAVRGGDGQEAGERDQILDKIGVMSRVVISKRKATLETLKGELTKYGASKKEELTLDNARKFAAYLEEQANG